MAELSSEEISIIKDHPLTGSLNSLCQLLQETEKAYESLLISEEGAVDSLNRLYRNALSKLVLALIDEAAAYNLHSRIADQNVESDLIDLFKHLRRDLQYGHYRPLVQLIIQKAPDVDIWKAVFDLIAINFKETSPVNVPPTFDGTPVKSTSSSQKGTEQTRRLVEERIFEEIRSCTFRGVDGFLTKYFEETDWSARLNAICQRVLDSASGARFPNPPVQNDVLKWWFQLQDDFLSDARSIYFSTASKADLIGSEAERQVDLLLKARVQGDSEEEKHDWKDILVVGELKQSSNEIQTKDTLLQLARYVREVFIAQPTRLFVHAFVVCGTKLEAWVFDRSGPYSSGVLDIYKDAKQCFQVILGYAMMSDEELGLDTFTTLNANGDRTITINSAGNTEEIVLRLHSTPLCSQYAIVCRGTSCFLTNGGDTVEGVAKFSWTSDKRQPEADLLQLACQRGVQGIAKVIGYRTITTIADLRCRLTFGSRYTFRGRRRRVASLLAHSRSRSTPSQPLTQLHSPAGTSRKRRLPDAGPRASKRLRSSNRQRRTERPELTFSVEPVHKPSLFNEDDEVYDNRILRCLVISPAGRPIYEYKSRLELLIALRDGLMAHRSLYLDGKILHRDISENNIIITDPDSAGGRSGMLIDLDLAKKVGSEPSGARHRTGTMEFMAIEVLLNVDHTYRHDLESFFYVLIWQCARRGWQKLRNPRQLQGQPKKSLLDGWYTGSYEQISRMKRADMSVDGFGDILQEFPPLFDCVKPLCSAIRDILFPYKNGLIVGTPQDPKQLYEPILKAYEDAISQLANDL
ncbi:hypothetical protein McanMca71_006189 [Microsporum canis]